jgi:preprotein translocase subunit YajC
VGDPAVSTAEDVVSGTVSLVSILTPLLALVFIVLGIWFLVTRLRRTEATF